MSVQKVLLRPFHCKTGLSGLSLASKGLENVPQVPGDQLEVCQNHNARKPISVTLSFKVKWGFISARKLESGRSKSFAVSISLQNKAIRT